MDHYKDKYRDKNFYDNDRSYEMDNFHGRDRAYDRNRSHSRDRDSSENTKETGHMMGIDYMAEMIHMIETGHIVEIECETTVEMSIRRKVINIREGLEIIMKMSIRTGMVGINMNATSEITHMR